MKKVKYYYLDAPLLTKHTGVKHTEISMGDQIYNFNDVNYQNKDQWSRYQKSYRFEHLPEDMDLNKFELHPKAKLTPILSSMFLGYTGLFISPDLHQFLQDYKAFCAKYYPITLTRADEKIDWYYMHILDAS